MTDATVDGVRHDIAWSSLKRGSVKALTYEEKNARQEEKFEYASWEDAVYSGGFFNGKGKREDGLFKDYQCIRRSHDPKDITLMIL